MAHKYELTISSIPGADHLIERSTSTDPEVRPGKIITQKELERLELTHRFKITLVRRK